ncbi:beta-galactosidase 8 isoform X1 [Amborella trichopoda]|uniref:Beta-galactosidase n=1 Tax=Amborella trichopoda TaxID=13333 RepID=U5D378_AMBTC|nr:beta-galactosidase 8 isoform X1 [Amborella trichopoda]ERN14823.1 hypothetical protein AMTR_s00032p00109160 [Amborella trichopoda]|eukprot:XP_020528404.1 beta-galactosidase 8 isoform X1 [Amborella trichopoda]
MDLFYFFLFVLLVFSGHNYEKGSAITVTYDDRALVIDGQRRLLFSGSIHYPRTTPEVWPEIIQKSKDGGLDVIETYVFWNYHEPERRQYNFEGRFDLVKFVKTVQDAGLYVHLRIGPYVCAEWNYGGFPIWLHFIDGIQFRTTNAAFKSEMEIFLAKIVNLMQDEKLFASEGGPIILAQVENEYGNVEWAYGIGGKLYVEWAASTAVSLNTTVPWVMCQQEDAPDPIINTCNGFYCDEFTPNSRSKPKMWTENYSGWFQAFGSPTPFRPVEDLAFAVARFFETGGTFQNYYMYFGGTNFGRTAGGPLIASSYDYDAPLDEYGYLRQPKWGHLRNLHNAIKQCEKILVTEDPTYISFGAKTEAHYYNGSDGCAAFLANIDDSSDANVTFNERSYFLPAWSVSILPDCKNVIFNTAKVSAQQSISAHGTSTFVKEYSLALSSWSWHKEQVGIWGRNSFTKPGLLEQINTTRDVSDFLWYTTSVNVDEKLSSEDLYLDVESLGHALLLFVNKKPAAFGYGNHEDASFTLKTPIVLNQGNNTLDLLSMMIGLQNYGPWFDIAGAGIFSVMLVGSANILKDFSSIEWTYQIGMEGEYLELYKSENNSLWVTGNDIPNNQSLMWYKATFDAPEGNSPLALNLASMGKGQVWVNGLGIGRYWPAYLAPAAGCADPCDYRGTYDAQKCLKNCGQPSQTLYHVPRSWLNPTGNVLVLLEELGGDPTKITIVTRTGQQICSHASESDIPPVDFWDKNKLDFEAVSPEVRISCERGWQISSVDFASFGTPQGKCGLYSHGSCSAKDVLSLVRKTCVGHESCSIPVSASVLGDPCPSVVKSLAIQATCTDLYT